MVKGWDQKIFAVMVGEEGNARANEAMAAVRKLEGELSSVEGAGKRGNFSTARYGVGRGSANVSELGRRNYGLTDHVTGADEH